MADGTVTIEVTLTKDQLESGLKSLKSSINNAIPSATSSLSTLSSAFTKLGNLATSAGKVCSTVTTAIAGVFTAAASKATDFIETYESAMVVFEKKLGETGADEMYETLLNIAKASTYAQEYLVSAGQTLVAMGLDANQTAQYLQIATDACAGMGKSGEDLESLAETLGLMSMQTTLYTDDLNQLLTNGIPVYDILATKYNTSTSAIKEMAAAGEITSEDFEYLMDVLSGTVEGMEEFSLSGTAAALKSGTLTGAIDSLGSSFRSFALDILGVNINAGQTENYEKAISVISKLGETISNIGDKFSFLGDWAGSALDTIGNALDKFNAVLDSTSQETLETIASVILKIVAAGPTLLVVGKACTTLGSAFKRIKFGYFNIEQVWK